MKARAKKLFKIPDAVTPKNFEAVMGQAITLELATIPTYLSTYYSIQRAPDQDSMCKKILGELSGKYYSPEILAQELTMDVLTYANKTAALIMGVLIEEMLHLALSSNVKQAICKAPPGLMDIAPNLKFPAQLDGHEPEFDINLGPLSKKQLITFLKIESPNAFKGGPAPKRSKNVKYHTIGEFYEMIEQCIKDNYPGPYEFKKEGKRLQLTADPKKAIYSPNSINTAYYDRNHNPHFINADDSGGLIEVVDGIGAIAALSEIVEQGEGNGNADSDHLKLDEHGDPVPLPVVDGKVVFKSGDYDDPSKQELSHFDKFMEAYSLGDHYEKKFAQYGLDFYSLFVYDQAESPKQADYDAKNVKAAVKNSDNDTKTPDEALRKLSELGNAVFTYILLMIETCYVTKSEKEQFQIFMYGVHKSMIWLLSQFGRDLTGLTYQKGGKTYTAALTFEFHDFSKSKKRPKAQILDIAAKAAKAWPAKEKWLTDGDYPNYLPALPDIDLNYNVKDIDKDLGIPSGAYHG